MSSESVLKFKTHDFVTRCYSACDMRVIYAGILDSLCNKEVGRAKTPEDDKKYPGGATGLLPAFASPVQVEWRSRDGVQHAQVLNFDDIFKDKIVLHKEDPKRIYRPMPLSGGPKIIVEVNDRTLSVYMFATIQLLPPDPNAVRRDAHDNRTLAYSKTF